MKNFELPVLEAVAIADTMESIYVGSGMPTTPTTPPTPTTPDDAGWDIHTEWKNHNTGHHSELAIIGYNNGKMSGEGIMMNFIVDGFRLDTIKDSSGYPVCNVCESGFTIKRDGHFNPNERFEFNIQITAKDSIYEGSVGKTGEYCPHKVKCVSYLVS